MENFWQFFVVFAVGLINGIILGRAGATTAILLAKQQQPQQQLPLELMNSMMSQGRGAASSQPNGQM